MAVAKPAPNASTEPSLEDQKKEALLKQAIAEARKAEADADRARISALVPNLADADKSTITQSGEPVVAGSLASAHALKHAATAVYKAIKHELKDQKILITSDEELADSDAIYVQVRTALDGLNALVDIVLPPAQAASSNAAAPLAAPVVGAIASAIPSVLALFSAKRTVKTAAVTVDTKSAVLAVTDGVIDMAGVEVWLDDVRPVSSDGIGREFRNLQDRRIAVQAWLDSAAARSKANGDRAALAKQVVAAIDSFATSVLATAQGATRSPFVTALLRERLHGSPPEITRVLVVAAVGGDSQQLVNDRPFWFEDHYSVLGTTTIRYALLEMPTGRVLAAGVESGTANLTGTFGSALTVQVATASQ